MNMKDKDLLNQFSAYVKVAIIHKRQTYMEQKIKIGKYEIPYLEEEEKAAADESDILEQVENMSENLEKENLEIKLLLNRIENFSLFQTINNLSRMQKEILLLRIFYMKSFSEIGQLLGISAKKTENTYFNTIRKIRKILGGKNEF